ncbi:MAG: FKBP-type peptidyl-prolyl cis-trans isomerase [Bacteroidales bacterium]|nr:FKBP-type peptidyl-prolyl cis-trans isomerase [Bacteroidales bacterium]MCF8391676.1 FKBP-type peptidyl-prolyl cis-trans isomerase [Bacteroidales bacterium]
MKNNSFLYLSFIVAFFLISSCSKDDTSELLVMEDRIFDNYLLSNNITSEPTASGLYYLEEVEGTGVAPVVNNWVSINYSIYTIHTGSLVATTNEVLARNIGIYDERVLYGPSKLMIGNNISGLDEGLTLMKEGGKANLLFKSDLGYGNKIIGSIDAYSSLFLKVELIKVITDPVQEEYENTIKFLEAHEYSTDTTDSGIYYIPVITGTGDSATIGDNITINIKASLLDGRVLYEANNQRFQIGSFEYNATFGLSEGLKLMKVGGTSRLVVPYQLAFGPYGKNYHDGYYRIPIPPYSTIVYDLSFVSL